MNGCGRVSRYVLKGVEVYVCIMHGCVSVCVGVLVDVVWSHGSNVSVSSSG